MKRIDPLAIVAALLFVALIVLSVVSARPASPLGFGRSGSTYDQSPGGASLFRQYLEAAGLRVTSIEGDRFAPNAAGVSVLFLLGPTDPIDAADRAQLHDYVRFGGILVIATDLGFGERQVLDEFGLPAAPSGLRAGTVPVRSIAFAEPPVRSLSIDLGIALAPNDDATPLVLDDGAPFVAVAREGRGTVYVVGSLAPFVNSGIALADNAHFGLVLAAAGTGRVGFDEYHHGAHPSPDFVALLERTWLGRALLAAGALLFVYIVLTGRRIGPPLPLDPRPPRSSLEYIRGFAGLVRRSGRGEIARRRLRLDLHRGLARLVGLDPATPFDRVAGTVEASSPSRAARARTLDAALAGRLRGDALVRAANEVQRLIHHEEAT